MKSFVFILLITIFSSCTNSSYKELPYSDEIIDKSDSFKKMPFTREAKALEFFHKYKEEIDAKKYIYKSDGHDVEGFIFKKKQIVSSHSPKGLIIFIRGGFHDFGRINLNSWIWMKPFISEGYDIVATQYRYNKLAVSSHDYLDKFGGEEVNDIENLAKIYFHLYKAPSHIYTISWGSRGGISTYRFLQKTELNISKTVIIEGASDFPLLERERGSDFFNFLDEDEKKKRDLKNLSFKNSSFFVIHSEKNKKTSVSHAINAKTILRERKNDVRTLFLKEEYDFFEPFFVQEILNWLQS